MKYRVLSAAGFGNGLGVAQIGLDGNDAFRKIRVPAASQNRNPVAQLQQTAGQSSAQKTAASGDQNVHKTFFRQKGKLG